MTDTQKPCAVAGCDVLIWWNPRKRRWLHVFENGNHVATPVLPTSIVFNPSCVIA